MKQREFMEELVVSLAPIRSQILRHSLYSKIKTLDDVRAFMEHHIFAVWDFMSLLTALKRGLTCVELPWIPIGNADSRRLINEIVLEEESDEGPEGHYNSHLELYLHAMRECGANTSKIDKLLKLIADHTPLSSALIESEIPNFARVFIETTWRIASSGSMHQITAAFTLGREDVIPDMFRNIISDLDGHAPGQLSIFQDYLKRHVELDEERHTPMGLQMLQNLCGDNPNKWREASETAEIALKARLSLWNGIADTLTRDR
jgi:hypothetical protein